jgi:nicotinate-nucleotide adenylyltransferase
MGADSFLQLRHWRRAAEIPFVAPLIVASRPGQPLDDLKAVLPAGLTMEPSPGPPPASSGVEMRSYLLANSGGDCAPFYLLPGLHIEISASEIRDQVRSAATAGHDLLPVPVSDYIRSHGLYR